MTDPRQCRGVTVGTRARPSKPDSGYTPGALCSRLVGADGWSTMATGNSEVLFGNARRLLPKLLRT